MSDSVIASPTRGLALLLGRRRLRFVLLFSLGLGLLLNLGWNSGLPSILVRTVVIGLCAMLAFGLSEQWPKRLPRWTARWVLQVLAVAASVPLSTWWIYVISTPADAPAFWMDKERLGGFAMLVIFGLLLAPWAALAALVRQKEALARHQRLVFDLERSELERQALDARLHLLQAQVAPHFLFNTLANVRALVDTGSPRASDVLESLIAYLRAAVPRLHEPATALGQELDLVRAYLELMHTRIPDRLQFTLHVDESLLSLRCPPLTLLTLVENAVRHGIDPNEAGGRIDIHVQRHGSRCLLRVLDSGTGLVSGGHGLGTGLTTLRERLALSFGENARLRVIARESGGVCAEVEIPLTTTSG
jgi:sensor histidine kinase YesM